MMESRRESLYDHPRYYDLVFGSDWKAEFDFLLACFERLASRTVRRVFEPACGTGRLLYRLAKAGYEVSGLDINPRAVEYCNARLGRHGFSRTAIVGDMADFRLSKKVDAAFNMINSFRHLASAASAEAHLQCMAKALARGGLYVLGMHLTPTVGRPMEEETWSARRGYLCVNTHLRTTRRDLRRREERCRMTCDVYTPTRYFQIVDELVFRTYTASQIKRLLSRVPEFEIAAIYDFHYRIERPVEIGPRTEDVVLVLRRR